MKVVSQLDKEQENGQDQQVDASPEKKGYIKVKWIYIVLGALSLVLLTFGATIYLLNGSAQSKSGNGSSLLSSNSDGDFSKLYEVYNTLENYYFEDVDKEVLVNGAINGMVDSLDDPYSDFMSTEEASSFHQSISSSFEGIGAEIQQENDQIVIVSPIKGAPAEEAGLKAGDIILEVDGESLQGMSSSNAVLLIRGEKGTKVNLTIQRPGQSGTMKVEITRDTIPIETVYPEMVSGDIAKIQITSFSENTAAELEKALKSAEEDGAKGIILDLRQNPGGLLDQAQKIANMFVDDGKILYQVEDRNGNKEVTKATGNGYKVSLPTVLLIDEGSASASEIVAGALKESADIPLIGVKSYGKGTVQSAQDFTDGSNLKFTTAKWLTPAGNWIHKKGINPDVKVELPEYANLTYVDPEEELKEGTSSSDVENIEKMLDALGFDPGTVDNSYDASTASAVKQFQKDQGIKETGIVTGETTTKLMNQLREKINQDNPQVKAAVKELKK